MSESMQEQIAAAILARRLAEGDVQAEAYNDGLNDAAAIARAFEPAVEGDDVVAGEHRDAHGRIWACPACAGVIPAHQMSQPMRSLHDEALAAPPAPHGDGSWVCGRCGEAPEIHASRSSRCIYDPVFKPVSAAPPTATTLVTEAMVERAAKALCVKADCTPGFWRSFVPEAETALGVDRRSQR